ncbi:MAG TPA: ABC transporter substrate-binding protein, partial [Desulfurivibrionaceae bacterium]|nr:ABC transporter substrate-binding protein [Desulfurivibrionaceae bacterium]
MSPNHLQSLVTSTARPFPLLAIIWALLLVACAQPGSQAGETGAEMTDQQPEVIVTRVVRQTVQVPATVAAPADPSPVELDISQVGTFASLDPQLAEDDNSLDLIESLFVGLTRFNHQTGAVEPALAESWQVSNDGRTWTFNLREDIFWVRTASEHGLLGSGRPEVTAERPVVAGDVVFAIQRVCDPRVATTDVFIFFIIDGCQEVHDLADPQPADLARISARAIGDSTLTIRLTEAAGYFETMTSHWLLKPVPAELVEEMGGDWAERESIWTNGPFVIGPGTV